MSSMPMQIANARTDPNVEPDQVAQMGGALIQHGRANNRIYLMRLGTADPHSLLPKLDALAQSRGYTKIFAKIPLPTLHTFLTGGYHEEARVPNFFKGRTTAVFLGKYFDAQRARGRHSARRREALDAALQRARNADATPVRKLPATFVWHSAQSCDAPELANLFRAVFETYPFPVHDPDFLIESMKTHTVYGCVRHRGELVAASSAETEREDQVVEMTDFATKPEYRGRGLARFLLGRMEADMAGHGMRTAYTIARARSQAMNKTFAARGYHYSGTLINNTQICGSLESMNVWHKPLT